MQPLGLVIHELLSNAQIHGALTQNDGAVCLRWSIDNGALVLHWQEKVITPQPPVLNEGFALQIIRTVVEHQLSGHPKVVLNDGVLEATIVVSDAVALAA